MQNPKANPRKGAKFVEIKILIATLSVAVMLGIWNLISTQAIQAEAKNAKPVFAPPTAIPSTDTQAGSALPTLVPLVDLSSITTTAGVVQSTSSIQPAQRSALPLRSVAIPTQVIVQKIKPNVEQNVEVIVSGGGGGGGGSAVNGGGGGGGGGGAPAPITNTGSSHP